MKIKINFKNKNFEVEVEKCKSVFSKARGLMFRKKEKALLFEFNGETRKSIHSLFVFFPFLAIWLDKKGEIVDKKVVLPFTFHIKPRKPFSRLLEIPLTKKYTEIARFLVGE